MPRKKQYDPRTALRRAMEIFWENGYEATSIQDLVEGIGINRFSLYDTFQGKRELFDASLLLYLDRQVNPLLGEMLAGKVGRASIQRYFAMILARLTGPVGPWGCFMVNTAVELAPRDELAAQRVAEYFELMEEAFLRALAKGRVAGEIVSPVPDLELARHLSSTVLSLCVLARTRATLDRMRREVEIGLSVLGTGGDEGGTPQTHP
jgi:TetR/AcrR family transcriptional repressor of nem operon